MMVARHSNREKPAMRYAIRTIAATVAATFALGASAQLSLPSNPLGGGKEKENLSKSDINLVVLSNKSAIDKCQDEHKKKEPKVSGNLLVRFEIEPSGKTSKVSTVSTQFKGSTFEKCVSDQIRNWTFPKHKNKGKPIDQAYSF
jgi:hypothetical protein